MSKNIFPKIKVLKKDPILLHISRYIKNEISYQPHLKFIFKLYIYIFRKINRIHSCLFIFLFRILLLCAYIYINYHLPSKNL